MKKENLLSIFKDFLLGTLSSGLVILITQLIVYPSISKNVSQDKFGTILTITGIINIISVVLGGSLNNIRLLRDGEYKKEGIKGDFSLLLLIEVILALIFCVVVGFVFKIDLSIFEKILLIVVLIIQLLHSYGAVAYRIKLNYVLMFWFQICRGLGYLIGLCLFLFFGNWVIIFLFGELIALMFLLATTNILKEPYKITARFFATMKDLLQLLMANTISNILNYLDRLIILPILGAGKVAIYYSVSILGKMALVVLSPMMGVALSYLVRIKSITTKVFRLIVLSAILVGIITYGIANYITPYFLFYFYPNIFKEASTILRIAVAGTSIGIIATILHPVLLRFSDMKWQTIIQIVFGIVYIVSGILLMKQYGLIGFCIGVLLSNTVRLLLMIAIGELTIRNKVKA
ncbi:lipopolysaccharide biosynthesis protein [Saccharococcus caldoxylosilyticus]|uniref:lipopolysaccharide biosynthesis protein n=1 Tax=Saccharococcus caldoxylosilyticus TaxID=81408 RepID=UPI001FCBD6B9|nr:hypothetical protein [Parageobacillus caldoxylosilyticus]BDG37650.1 capsular polysaccharide biosynthesis protein [Parageobacillus caldoxylosilyticus]BDG41442.1 capsular polysaccharide biosynthesis protein [Parageobacillus caldoxylosilyticus]